MMIKPKEYALDWFENFNRVPGVDLNMIKYLVMVAETGPEGAKDNAVNMLKQFKSLCLRSQNITEKPFLKVPDRRDGEILLGHYFQGNGVYDECRINFNELPQTAVIAGIGKGKTRFLFNLVKQINIASGNKVSVIILDKKKDFRNLDVGQIVFDINELRINIFDPPPGVGFNEWLSELADLVMSIGRYYYASRNQYVMTVNQLYESTQKVPTFFEVHNELKGQYLYDKKMSYRKTEILEVLMDRASSTARQVGECFSTRKTFPLNKMLEEHYNIVIEADVSSDVYALLLGWLMLYIYHYNKAHDIRGNISKDSGTVIVADEAYWIWEPALDMADQRKETGGNFINRAPLLLRDFQIAIIAASQRPMSSDIMSSSNIKISGNVGDYRDASALANNMGNPQLVSILPKLGLQEFMIKRGDDRAALLKSMDFDFRRIPDEEVKPRMRPFVNHVQDWCKEDEEAKPEIDKQKHIRLSDKAKEVMFNILEHPDANATFLYKLAKLSNDKAQSVVQELEDAGYIKVVKLAIRNRRRNYQVLLTAGIEFLRNQGRNVGHVDFQGNQTAEHRLIQTLVSSGLRKQGYNVFHDHKVGEKIVDVFCDGIAYEVALDSAVDAERVRSALAGGVKRFVFLCADTDVMAQMTRKVQPGPAVEFKIATDFVETLLFPLLDYSKENQDNDENHTE